MLGREEAARELNRSLAHAGILVRGLDVIGRVAHQCHVKLRGHGTLGIA